MNYKIQLKDVFATIFWQNEAKIINLFKRARDDQLGNLVNHHP